MIRLGIIGIEFGQRVLLPAFRTIDSIEVVGFAATSLEHAQKACEHNQIARAYASWHDMIHDSSINALAIAVPPMVQEEIVSAALQMDKHLFCEKPLGISLSKTEYFFKKAERRKLANMVDFEFHVIAVWKTVQDILKSGELGDLHTGILNWQLETYANRLQLNNWKTKSSEGGGVLFNFASHVFYNLEWLCGPIHSVFMAGTDKAIHGVINFIHGLTMTYCVGTASQQGSGQQIEIYGETGSVKLINNTRDVINGFKLLVWKNGQEKITRCPSQGDDGRIFAVSMLAKRFANWILTGQPEEPSFFHGHRVNILLHACLKSQKTKRFVIVP